MNRMLLTGMIVMLTFISCSDKKTTGDPLPEPQLKAAAPVDPVAQKVEALKKAEALDMSEMQKMLPEEMGGIKRSNISMNSNLGYSMTQADYEKKGKNAYHLIMYDCTGEQGSSLYKNSYASYLGKSTEGPEGYVKTIDLMGARAIERYETASAITTISFFANDKILVVLSGKNVPTETLKEAAQKLNLKVS